MSWEVTDDVAPEGGLSARSDAGEVRVRLVPQELRLPPRETVYRVCMERSAQIKRGGMMSETKTVEAAVCRACGKKREPGAEWITVVETNDQTGAQHTAYACSPVCALKHAMSLDPVLAPPVNWAEKLTKLYQRAQESAVSAAERPVDNTAGFDAVLILMELTDAMSDLVARVERVEALCRPRPRTEATTHTGDES